MKPWYSFSIGELPPSVNAMYKRSSWGGVMKTESVLSFEKSAFYEMPKVKKVITERCRMEVTFTVLKPSVLTKRDIDNMLKVLQDTIQARGLIENDSLIFELASMKIQGDRDNTFVELKPLLGHL